VKTPRTNLVLIKRAGKKLKNYDESEENFFLNYVFTANKKIKIKISKKNFDIK